MRTILFALFLFSNAAVNAQSASRLQPAAMQEDFAYLRHYLESTHPGFYKHSTREQMQLKMDSLAHTLDQPLPFLEFYKKISYLIAEVRCEHTSCNYGKGFNELVESAGLLPLQLYFLKDKVQVLVNLAKDTTVHVGDEVLSINGYPIDSIRRVLYQFIPADAYMSTSKDQQLSGMAFNIWYYLFVEQAKLYKVVLRTKTGLLFTKSWKATKLKTLNKQAFNNPVNSGILKLAAALQTSRKEPLQLEILPGESAAVLTVHSFVVEQARFRTRVDSFFNTLAAKNIQKLIIDLRNNGGGDVELSADLLNYFITQPTSLVEYSYLITDKEEDLKLSNIPEDVRQSKYDYIEPLKEGKSYARLTKYSGELKTLQPLTNRFAGKVFLFVNGGTASAASTFSAVMKSMGLARIIGDETAGCYEGGGSTLGLDLVLPNSKITAHTAIVYQRFRTSGGDPHRGVLPDVPYNMSLEELLAGEKKWRQYILNLQ